MRDVGVGATKKIGLQLGIAFTLLILSNCRSAPSVVPEVTSDSAATAFSTASASSKPITFVDKPELQSGTGAMDADASLEFSETDSGLKYRVLRRSSGKKPTGVSNVMVNYRGWLRNGKVFDSSYERGSPTSFPLNGVIAGWTEGMQLIGEGGMIELWVPSRLGYGEQGAPGSIPAHSNLHFIVELIHVE